MEPYWKTGDKPTGSIREVYTNRGDCMNHKDCAIRMGGGRMCLGEGAWGEGETVLACTATYSCEPQSGSPRCPGSRSAGLCTCKDTVHPQSMHLQCMGARCCTGYSMHARGGASITVNTQHLVRAARVDPHSVPVQIGFTTTTTRAYMSQFRGRAYNQRHCYNQRHSYSCPCVTHPMLACAAGSDTFMRVARTMTL